MHYSFYHVVLVKFSCDVITRSCLQVINTLIDTLFSKLRAFLVVLVKFYCDVIIRSHLELINTSIDTFFSKLNPFLVEQRERERPMIVRRKLGSAVDETSADQEICKSDATVHSL